MTETQTYTYDTSDDPVAIEQAEQRDAETLELGEKMMAEQENLLAGKYKNAEELETAYKELEKKLGTSSESKSKENTTQEGDYQFYTEDGSVNYEAANELYGEQLSKTFQNANIDPFAMNEHFAKNQGTLNSEMYGELEKAGLPKTLVDSYLQGVRQEMGWEGGSVPEVTESDVNEVKAVAGGDEGYKNLMDWASANLPAEDIKSFDEIIDTGNKTAVKFAVKALMGQYEDAAGRNPDLIQGKKSAPKETYRSMAQVVRDMNNPLYESDESFRDDVRRKLEQSNLKV